MKAAMEYDHIGATGGLAHQADGTFGNFGASIGKEEGIQRVRGHGAEFF